MQNLPQNILEILPLDLQSNQRFVLDPNQPKTNLNLQFDFSHTNNSFSHLTKVYSVSTFEFNINANLHGYSVFKNNINFKVKGFDILKAIQMKLKEITANPDQNYPKMKFENMYSVNVFSNIQCSFNVDFCVSNMNIAKFLSSSAENNVNFNIDICEIKIITLNFSYTLPLTVFFWRGNYSNPFRNFQMFYKQNLNMQAMKNMQAMQNMQNYQAMQNMQNYQAMKEAIENKQIIKNKQNLENMQNKNMMQSKQNLQQKMIKKPNQQAKIPAKKNFLQKPTINLTPYSQLIQETRGKKNFSNWHSFMTTTTPIFIETESMKIKDIFYALKKPALFGVKCTFEIKEKRFTHVNYYPAIASINIYIQEDQNPICVNWFERGGQQNYEQFEKFEAYEKFEYENSFDSQMSSSSVPSMNPINIIKSNSNNYQFEAISPNISFNSINESGINLSNLSNSSLRSINYEEENKTVFSIKNLNEQIREIDKSEPELKTLTLDEIDKESWFSIIWYPLQTFQTKLKIHGTFVQEKNLPIFKVYYQFHQARLSHNGKFLTVIGVIPLTQTLHEQVLNEKFWFRDRNDMENEEHFKYNKKLYYSLVEQARLIEI